MANFKSASFTAITEHLGTTMSQKAVSWGIAAVLAFLITLLSILMKIHVNNTTIEDNLAKAVIELPLDMVPQEVLKELADKEAMIGDPGSGGANPNDPSGSNQHGGGIDDHIQTNDNNNTNTSNDFQPIDPIGTRNADKLNDMLKKSGNKRPGSGSGTSPTGDGKGGGNWGNGTGGGGTSPIPGGSGKAKRAGAAGYAFTCNTNNLKNAPRGTYQILVEVDCSMHATYLGYQGGTAQDSPSEGKSVAKTIQAFLGCATISKTSAAVCPQKVIVQFSVDY